MQDRESQQRCSDGTPVITVRAACQVGTLWFAGQGRDLRLTEKLVYIQHGVRRNLRLNLLSATLFATSNNNTGFESLLMLGKIL